MNWWALCRIYLMSICIYMDAMRIYDYRAVHESTVWQLSVALHVGWFMWLHWLRAAQTASQVGERTLPGRHFTPHTCLLALLMLNAKRQWYFDLHCEIVSSVVLHTLTVSIQQRPNVRATDPTQAPTLQRSEQKAIQSSDLVSILGKYYTATISFEVKRSNLKSRSRDRCREKARKGIKKVDGRWKSEEEIWDGMHTHSNCFHPTYEILYK